MSLNFYTALINELDLLDNSNFNTSDADRLFIAVNSGVRGQLNPANALVRYQMIEVFYRIALAKFFQKQIDNESDSIQVILEQYVSKLRGKYDQCAYRRKNFWTMEVDNILKAFRLLFK